jgi:hypothetical protein
MMALMASHSPALLCDVQFGRHLILTEAKSSNAMQRRRIGIIGPDNTLEWNEGLADAE